jgi:putative phosphoesterase
VHLTVQDLGVAEMKSNNHNQLIGVISDTHDQITNLRSATDIFLSKQVSCIVHCGDWVSPFTLKFYQPLNVPIFGVFGNNDGDKFRHLRVAEKLELDLTIEDQLLVFSRFGKRMAIYHGDYREIVDALVKCGDYDVVFHGHNHQAKIEIVNKIISLNPGTLVDFTNENIQGASVGVYDASNHSGEIIWLDAT